MWIYFYPCSASKPIMDSQPTDQGIPFEQSLEQFLLEAYTYGHAIEGEWQVTVPISDAPDWTVTITRSYSEEESSYQPTFIKE